MKFIDLYAGLGATRLAFEQHCKEIQVVTKCVMTSEIKSHAIETYKHNFKDDPAHNFVGDISKINPKDIPDHDFLLAGFPCQSFSMAGKKRGFADSRGTAFFDVAAILKHHQPSGFLLENVAGLIVHDKGQTLKVILHQLTVLLGYDVYYSVVDSSNHACAQKRKRIFILGNRRLDATPAVAKKVDLHSAHFRYTFQNICEARQPTLDTKFSKIVLGNYPDAQMLSQALLYKKFSDRRGGLANIHSWDISLRGHVPVLSKRLMGCILAARRNKKWIGIKGISKCDGVPLTALEIYDLVLRPEADTLESVTSQLDTLVEQGYLKKVYPWNTVDGKRVRDKSKPLGYDIKVNNFNFEINRFLGPRSVCPTITATECSRIGTVDGYGIRALTIRELFRLFTFPESYWFPRTLTLEQKQDLIGNTIVINAAKEFLDDQGQLGRIRYRG